MSSIKKSLLWSFSERYLSQIVTLISSMILARLLSPEQIGIYSLCAAITAMATIFRDFGVSEYIIQEKNLTKDKLQGAYALSFIMAWSMAIILFFSKDIIAEFYNEQGVSDIISILCINFIILPFASPAYALLNREMAFNKVFFVQFPSTIIQASTSVLLAYFGFSYMSLAWASLVGIISQTIIITLLRPKESLMFPSIRQIKNVWRFGLTFSSSHTIEVIMNNSHELIIGRQFGFNSLGLFSRAQGLNALFWQNVTSAITRVAAPSFAASFHKSPEKLIKDYSKSIGYFTVLSWPFFAFAGLEADSIIYILFGEQWMQAAPIVTILIFDQLLGSMAALAPNVLVAIGQVKKRLIITLIVAPIHIVSLIMASQYSIMWVAAVFVFMSVIRFVLYQYYLQKTLNFSYFNLFNSVKVSFLVAVFPILAVVILRALVADQLDSIIIRFIIDCIIITVTWFLCLFLFKHQLSQDIKALLPLNKLKNVQ